MIAAAVNILICGTLVLLSTVTISQADDYPGDAGYNQICNELLQYVSSNSVPFKQRDPPCPLNNCSPSETVTLYTICQRITEMHNDNAASYIGGVNIYISECLAAFASPQSYGPADWNKWAGKHCGKWYNVGTPTPFIDNANWYLPTTYTNTHGTFHRQNVLFNRPGTCCDNGWNESGGSLSVVWGWDPKDINDHGGYQGSCVGYSFTKGPASCLIWVTGQEAFLECVATGSWGRRRTSAGFWGYGLWSLHNSGPLTICRQEAQEIRERAPHNLLGEPIGK